MQNYYVVISGRKPGVYLSWDECKVQVSSFSGAKFKKVKASSPEDAWLIYGSQVEAIPKEVEILEDFLSVDGASDGKSCEYRGVWVDSKKIAFASPKYEGGTNNIAEFLGLVHACKYLKEKKLPIKIYTDSITALAWFRNKKAKTSADLTGKMTEQLRFLIEEAEDFLYQNDLFLKEALILKWETKDWGEIPADYGRK